MVSAVHSVPAEPLPVPCAPVPGRPATPALRPYVTGYGGFRAGVDAPVRHRVLPSTGAALVVDLTGASRIVTGPRSTPLVHRRTAWRQGVIVGLTPDGVSAVLGGDPRDLVDRSLPLADVLGRSEAELAERLAAAPTWPARFAVLERWLGARLGEPPVTRSLASRGWWRLEQTGGRVPIGTLADELAVGRRGLEVAFRRRIGMSPGTVARVARLQRALGRLTGSRCRTPAAGGGSVAGGGGFAAGGGGFVAGGGFAAGTSLARVAAEAGYADQPHFTREVRALTGLTPTQLFAFVQDPPVARR